MTPDEPRIEHDSLGEVRLPAGAIWGAQTQRAVDNFPISGQRMPTVFIRAVVYIKASAARVNGALGTIPAPVADAIVRACEDVLGGGYDDQFPVDVFQTGSGTSTNMNVNEVLAHLASARAGVPVHPNDHVNRGQSSNDVVPTAIHVSAVLQVHDTLLPAVTGLVTAIRGQADQHADVVKTGRTHLMDAMPLTVGQEFGAWAAQLETGLDGVRQATGRCLQLAQGGTAVGTGVNADPGFAEAFATDLANTTGHAFSVHGNRFARIAGQDAALALSASLRTLATAILKICNDLRWMNSGPLTGLGEITLPALQPGSSIMPGKVNPVIPESVAMVCVQVTGNDLAVALAAQSGNFQLNVMLPLIAHNLLESIALLANASRALAEKAVAGLALDVARLERQLSRNPILVTALVPHIGYEAAARIAKLAYATGRPILDVAAEETDLDRATLERVLDPHQLV